MTARLAQHERNSVDATLDLFGRETLLTHEEEIHLARQVQRMLALEEEAQTRELNRMEKGLVRKGRRAKDRIITANLRLVVFVARKYCNRRLKSLDMVDLIQEGSTGLVRAAEKFDPARGYKFSTYAYWWIRQAITRAINQQEWMIRRPHHIAELAGKIPKTYTRLMQELHRSPTAQELADALAISIEELELLRHRGSGTISLDSTVLSDNDSSKLLDLVVYENDLDRDDSDLALDLEMRRPVLEAAMAHLSEQERDYLTRKFGLVDGICMTNADMAREAGTSRERVRQILERAVRKLRFQLARAGLNPLATRSPLEELVLAKEHEIDPEPAPVAPAPVVRKLPQPIPETLPLEERRVRWTAPTRQSA